MAVERSELRLVWPARLFATEAQALLDAGAVSSTGLGFLLDEAFHGDRGYKLFVTYTMGWIAGDDPEPWTAPGKVVAAHAHVLITELIRDAPNLPRYEPPRYWSARRRPAQEPPPPLTLEQTKTAYADLIAQLEQTGYFEDAFGSSRDGSHEDPWAEGQRQLADLLQTDVPLWPMLQPDPTGIDPLRVERNWSADLFCDVVEALHDLVARPRRRYMDQYGGGWKYADFARSPGQAVYRWKVNEILARSELGLQLAETGEDLGRLIHAAPDDRDRLLDQVFNTPDRTDQDEIRHAVALFRSRTATRKDKRSAIVALARVLEPRRSLIRTQLGKRDEDALFQIANKFDLRHRNADQHPDYDEAYLDWIYWWYLATIELTDRLLARQP